MIFLGEVSKDFQILKVIHDPFPVVARTNAHRLWQEHRVYFEGLSLFGTLFIVFAKQNVRVNLVPFLLFFFPFAPPRSL